MGVKMKQKLIFNVDLVKLEGKGDFLCPCCGIMISPDDETEEVYSILKAEVRNDLLENLLIRCNNCSNEILLTGFSIIKI